MTSPDPSPAGVRFRLRSAPAWPLLGLVVAWLAATSPSPANAQPVPEVSTVDRIFQEWDREGSPGCAVGVYHRGELVLARGYGEANLDWAQPITSSTVFYSGSVSKQFAAATAALMHLDGTLDLDHEVRRYIPELPPYDPPVTVRQLVHHTSGVRDIYGLISLSGGRTADAWTDEEYLELIAAQRDLNFPAGSEYSYSNGAYYLLTTTIERASEMRLDEAAREYIFEPLGMDDTHFHQDVSRIVPRRAMSYGGNAESGFQQTYLGNFDKAGAGGLYTTIEDMAAWDRNFETGEVGGSAFLELIHTPGVLTSGDTLSYAFGLQLGELNGRRTVGHSGSFMGFRADFIRLPDDGMSVAALCNLGGINPSSLNRELIREAFGDDPPSGDSGPTAQAFDDSRERPDPPSLGMRDFAGAYGSDEVGSEIRVEWDGARLRGLAPGAVSYRELEWQGADRFEFGSWTLEFEVEDGAATGFRLDAGRVRNLLFQRVSP
jgi:CubicO group peptidase (beta-lactamase class C family)